MEEPERREAGDWASVAMADVKPLVDRAEIWPGAKRVFLEVEVPGGTTAGGRVRLKIDDAPVEGELVALVIRRSGEPALGFGAWWGDVRPVCRLTAEDIEDDVGGAASGSGVGAGGGAVVQWFIVVPVAKLMEDATRLGDSRVQWGDSATVTLANVDLALLEDGRRILRDVAREQLRGVADTGPAMAMVSAAAVLPSERWRASLVARVLNITLEGEAPLGAMAELCEQIGSRRELAIGRLARADDALAERVAGNMVSMLRTEKSAAPMWSLGDVGIELIVAELLQPRRARESLIARAKEFVDSRATAVASVLDDAAGGWGKLSGARVLAGNLSAKAVLARVGLADARVEGPVTDLPAHSATEIDWTPGDDQNANAGSAGPTAVVVVRMGSSATRLGIVPAAVPATPPGLDVGPMLRDWSSGALVAGQPVTAGVVPRTEVLVEETGAANDKDRPPTPTDAALRFACSGRLLFSEAGGVENAGEWIVYLDLSQGDDALSMNDEVTLWLGPMGQSRYRLAVKPDGQVRDVTRGGAVVGPAKVVKREAAAGRPAAWAVWVPIPAGAIEPNGVLRLAVTRTDSRSVRSAWPRPMLPWQREPGRIGVETTGWLGLPK